MPNTIWGAVRRVECRMARALRRWNAERRVELHLSDLNDDELGHALADAGLTRSDLPTIFGSGHRRRRLMTRMMSHFRVDPKRAALGYQAALRDAERVCANCANVKRCRRWFDWGRRNDAPRVFCPNAELFDEVAEQQRR